MTLLGRIRQKATPRRRQSSEINIWRLQALFQNFRKILQLNNRVLEEMAHLERTLGGEFIFDRTYLAESVRSLAAKVHHITYNLNALTGNAYVPLYDSYQEILGVLDDILSGNTRALASAPALPLEQLGWELEPLVGIHLVCLAELRHQQVLQAAGGFVLTAEGCLALAGAGRKGETGGDFTAAEVRDELRHQFQRQRDEAGTDRFTLVASRIEAEDGLVTEVGRFHLPADREGPQEEATAGGGQSDPWPGQAAAAVERLLPPLLREAADEDEEAALVLHIRPAPAVLLSGTVVTDERTAGGQDCLLITAVSANPGAEPDRYRLRRTSPYGLLESVIAPRPAGQRFADGRQATDRAARREDSSLARGSALLPRRLRTALAETALLLERQLGLPVTLEWEERGGGACLITGLLPLPAHSTAVSPADVAQAQERATVLCRGGQTVQAGVGAGRVVQVGEETASADFPTGAIAVARFASPQLTPILQRAAAVISEYGSAAGHLATVARELRLPAIFGLEGATQLLPPEVEVTVDAGAGVVYAGILDILLRHGADEFGFSPSDEEYRALRRLLRFIMPLSLIDPEAENFSPEGCRSLHDIIHFCHEKAVDELAHFQERRPGLGAIRTKRMQLGVPMDIRVLDIGGGMAADPASPPTPGDVRSRPFAAFLAGLLQPEAWADNQPSLGLRDIVSAMPRSVGMLGSQAESLGENLAIVGHDYTNISLRLGYHFSVIDAHIGSDDSRNHVYFRFVGGLADAERRGRRARFIREVLAAMDFKISVQGDLVIGRIKSVHGRRLTAALRVLGALTAFAKQRDTALFRDEDVDTLFHSFAEAFLTDYRAVVSETYAPAGEE